MAKKTTSANRKARYAAQPARTQANKVRKMEKHARRYPNDMQTAAKLAALK